MKPLDFKGANTIIAKDQPEYLPLPAKVAGGIVTTCWGMTFKERFRVFFTGRVWLQQMTFNQPLQPQKVTVEASIEES